jgi:arabinan endo-1,5-alpha-L-arabinosidase
MRDGLNRSYMKISLGKSFLYYWIMSGLLACGSSEALQDTQSHFRPEKDQPTIDANFPDPTLVLGHDGYYYVYATNTERDGKLIHIQVAKSKDLKEWEMLEDALPDPPVWADRDFWAPHVTYDSLTQTYFLYYSGESVDPALGKCMGVATSKNPAGPFVDQGEPLLCGETFVEIDPMAFDDPVSGKKYLYWGSGHQPIKVQELADDRMAFLAGSAPLAVLDTIGSDDPDNYQRLVEGPWVVYREGYYYLFYSGDNCCGEHAHYALMVARSKSPTGPFETLAESRGVANSVIMERYGQWIAIGHNSLIQDESGQDWVAYHGIDTLDRAKGRVMLMDKIIWEDGWPTIQIEENNKR